MKQILITGGLGFIGRHLVDALLTSSEMIHIDIVDNLSNCKLNHSELKWPDECVTLTTCSVRDFRPKRVYDEIYHLASPVGPAAVLQYAGKMAPMIVSDAYQMGLLALEHGARLLFLSSSEVYGKTSENLVHSEDLHCVISARATIRMEYGVAKLLAEILLLNLCKVSNLYVNIIRPFNIVGFGQNPDAGFVLPRFVRSALTGAPITIFGTGLQKRAFTAVDDLIQAMVRIMSSSLRSELLNLGNPNNVCSVLDLAKLVARLAGSQSSICHVDPKEIYGPLYEEAFDKVPDVTRLHDALGWAPSITLEELVLSVIKANRLHLVNEDICGLQNFDSCDERTPVSCRDTQEYS